MPYTVSKALISSIIIIIVIVIDMAPSSSSSYTRPYFVYWISD